MVEKIKRQHDPEWHLLEAFFTREDGIEPSGVDGVPVLIPGKLAGVPVIQIPASATPDVFDRISKAVVEAAGVEPFIITSNVQLLRMRKVSDKTAKAMMAETRAKMKRIEAERDRLQHGEAGDDAGVDVIEPESGATDAPAVSEVPGDGGLPDDS